MKKKSFLGRLFGRKDSGPRHLKSDSKSPGTTSPGSTGTPLGLGVKEKGKNRIQKGDHSPPKPQGVARENTKTAVAEKKAAERIHKPEVKKEETVKGPMKPIKPEILDRSEKESLANHEKIDVIAKKMSAQEEVAIKMSDGIKGISSLLSNIDQRLEEQTQQSYEMVRTVKTIPEMMKDLPESSRAGVELLQAISQVLENQSRVTAEFGEKISGLPEMMAGLGEKMEREAKDRQEETITLNRERVAFKGSVDLMKKSVEHLEKRQQESSNTQHENTRKLVQSIVGLQSDYQNQVNRLVDKNRMTNRLILVMIFIIAAGLVSIIGMIAQ